MVFCGIDLPAGPVLDQTEWNLRIAANLYWIQSIHDLLQPTVMVILGHAAPTTSQNAQFFSNLFTGVNSTNMTSTHFVYVYRNTFSETFQIIHGYDGLPNLDVVAVWGGHWPPMKLQIQVPYLEGVPSTGGEVMSEGSKVFVTINQKDWLSNLTQSP